MSTLTSTSYNYNDKDHIDIIDFIESTIELQEATRQAIIEDENDILEIEIAQEALKFKDNLGWQIDRNRL